MTCILLLVIGFLILLKSNYLRHVFGSLKITNGLMLIFVRCEIGVSFQENIYLSLFFFWLSCILGMLDWLQWRTMCYFKILNFIDRIWIFLYLFWLTWFLLNFFLLIVILRRNLTTFLRSKSRNIILNIYIDNIILFPVLRILWRWLNVLRNIIIWIIWSWRNSHFFTIILGLH